MMGGLRVSQVGEITVTLPLRGDDLPVSQVGVLLMYLAESERAATQLATHSKAALRQRSVGPATPCEPRLQPYVSRLQPYV